MNISKRYYAGSEDGKSISFQKEEEMFCGSKITIRFWHVGVIAVMLGMVIGGNKYINTVDADWMPGTSSVATETMLNTVNSVDVNDTFDENGFVFADSSKRILSREEVLSLKDNENPDFQRLVRMTINEIYARHGQVFELGETNDVYYQGCTWYKETNKHFVEWEEFNEIEKTNLRLLISIEEEYGYR